MTHPSRPSLAAFTLPRRNLLRAGAGLAASSLLPAMAQTPAAQPAGAWPTKTIRIIAAQAPGSSNDATARAFSDYFSQKLGVPVVVENKPGGVGMIAAEALARSAPDGHTLMLTLHSQPAQAPAMLKKMPIDPDKDIVPIASIGVGPVPGLVHKDFPVNNVAELIAYARKKPVNVGNYAIGSGWQLMLTQLAKETGAQFNIVNYKGTGAMLMDLYGGQIDMGAGSLAGVAGGIQKGQVRPIVIAIGSRSSRLQGIPTWVEAGFKGAAFEDLAECNMLFAPAGTPPAILERLAGLVRDSVTESAKVKSMRDTLSADDVPLTGPALQAFIKRTWPTYRRLTREVGISAD